LSVDAEKPRTGLHPFFLKTFAQKTADHALPGKNPGRVDTKVAQLLINNG